MGIRDIIKKSFLEGFATSDIHVDTIFICIFLATMLAAYILLVYRQINKNSFYNRSFGLSLLGMAVFTAAIILTIQSNIVVSLGMVGALSIVRFRTAIKDPMDLVFLFWSICVGIICGAGFAMIAVIVSLWFTVLIILFNMIPGAKENLILVVNADSCALEADILQVVKNTCKYSRVRARNASKTSLNMAIEVRPDDQAGLICQLVQLEGISYASLVEHDGEVTA